MMSKHRLLSVPPLALLALAMACGESEERKKIENEDPTMDNPVAYFGMEACTCYEYVTVDNSDTRRLGVAVERVDDFYSDVAGKDVHAVVYRLGGAVQKTYVVDPTNPDLRLTRVKTGAMAGDDEWRMSPGMSLAHWLEDTTKKVTVQSQVTRYQNAIPVDDEPQTLDIHTLLGKETPVKASLDDGATEQDYQATLIEYSGTPWSEPKRWFVPEVGTVQLEFNGTRWILRNKRTLAGGCPGDTVKDICGTKAP